ncbi:hypothetical protein CTI12_AA373430 [Artemisia annua]|uniref:Reverse transcriptase domain-containing protein n=1 Tax=Artemisia annua TaxID=35608 RepID=A0A2U1MIZ1_ARTAN|nr:hypothetical protein CTI12_AA373430 [Artemisia annua]
MARGAGKTHIGLGNEAKYRVGPQGWYTMIEYRPPNANRKVSLEEMVDMHIEESSKKYSKFQEWMNEMKVDTERNLRNQNAAIKNLKTKIEQMAKKFQVEKPEVEFEECKLSAGKQCCLRKDTQPASRQGTKSRKILLPCTIGNFDMFAVADLGASVNMMSFSLFKKLNLINLKKTTSMVEMADMSRTTPKGTVDNILLRINKFIFPGDFLVIDMIDECNNNLILGRPFLATSHANIKVFEKEITLENGKEKITFNHNGSLKSINTNLEEVCMIKEANNASTPTNVDLYTKPVLCDSDSCKVCNTSHFEERVSYSKQAQNRHNRIISKVMDGRNPVLKNHYCNPIIMVCNGTEQAWPSCDPFHYICDRGDNGELDHDQRAHLEWTCFHGTERRDIDFGDLSFQDWYKVRFGNTIINEHVIKGFQRDYDYYQSNLPFDEGESDLPEKVYNERLCSAETGECSKNIPLKILISTSR